MFTYVTDYVHVESVKEDRNFDDESYPKLTPDELDTLNYHLIKVLSELQKVARELEADKEVTVSGCPCLLRYLVKTMRIMGGNMEQNSSKYYRESKKPTTVGVTR